jgi:hypothetical protein
VAVSRSGGPGWAVGPAVAGLLLAPLLFGYRPVGGDPDRLFRPIKEELARALRDGRPPFWSDRLGLGFPLMAESHAAALYPPNWLLYRHLDVDTAYAWAMWAHQVALAAAVALYARRLGIGSAGASLASLGVAFCGFLSIHSSHEWAYHGLFYAVLALLAADGVATTGRLAWAAGLGLASGMGWLVGHFQMQAWALPVMVAASAARLVGLPAGVAFSRGALILVGVGWGVAIAAAQLAPSWELARWTGSDDRDRTFYSYPPAHVVELAWPSVFRTIGPEDPSWFREMTTGYEACLFVGVPALALACVGALGWRRPARVWVVLTAATFALATMPRWWPAGSMLVTRVPGIGLFRCPARWTAFTSLGLALLAGFGLDRAIGARRSGAGVALAFGFAGLGLAGRRLGVEIAGTAVVWGLTLSLLVLWRRWSWAAWALVALAGVELGWWYYHATTVWGREAPLPSGSPLLARLAQEENVGLVAGPLDDLPLRGGWATAEPYVGFTLDPVNGMLRLLASRPDALADLTVAAWLSRRGVTHAVVEGDGPAARGEPLYDGPDAALDRLARSPRAGKRWRLYRIGARGPAARVVRVAGVVASDRDALAAAMGGMVDGEATVGTSEVGDLIGIGPGRGRVVEWGESGGRVEHDGPCVVLVDRIDFPGWSYRVDGGSWRPPRRMGGGQQALVLDGAGASVVELRYEPTTWAWWSRVSLSAGALAVGVVAVGAWRARGRRGLPHGVERDPPVPGPGSAGRPGHDRGAPPRSPALPTPPPERREPD